jgi:serine/threonine protein kinase
VSLRKLGRYDLVRVLGKGAMGIVYEGRDPNLDRHVAIKTVKVENLSEEAAAEYEARFRTEARSAARLQHPNIVSVYDSDRDGDMAFLVMEYIQGDDLKHHLDKGVRYSLEQSLKMIRDLLSALDYAHRQGVVHRDIKPANLLIEPGGRVKLTDFGVARMQDSGDATRTQGTMVGTLKYMSPEQVQGQKIDARADLFSVGVVLYQLLTDKRPFDGENDFSIIHQIIGHTPPPPSSFNARLPAAIDAVVARALAKDREQRFASAREFASALQSAMRRAEDATVIPPADPSRKSGAGPSIRGSQSLTGGVTAPTGGSTVTQELELVYWKDIKDSGDPEELQDFLAKFPAGIYADLARRRLRKLASGMIFEPTFAEPAADDLEATRMREPTTPPDTVPATMPAIGVVQPAVAPAQVEAPAAAGAASEAAVLAPVMTAPPAVAAVGAPPPAVGPAAGGVADLEPAFASTVLEPHDCEASPQGAEGEATVCAKAADALNAEAATPPAPSARRKPVIAVMAAVGVLAIAGIAALMMGKSGGEKPLAGPASAASATASVVLAPLAGHAVEAGTAATAVPAAAARQVAASSVASVHPAASASRRTQSSARSKIVASTPAVEEHPAPAAPAPVREAREEARPPSVPGPNPARGSPVDVCKDKMFLSREFCLAEQCEKPGTRNHPLCVKRREDAKLREESKIRY